MEIGEEAKDTGKTEIVSQDVSEKANVPTFAVPQSRLNGQMAPPMKRPAVGTPAIQSDTDAARKDAAFARSLAASAGARAIQNVAPGQKERAISQAAAAAASAYAMTKKASGDSPAVKGPPGVEKSMPSYQEPDWGAAPSGAEFFLEVMKGGQIVEKEELRGKSCFTIGRVPTCDLVQQHPSISRLHAVLQFQGDKGGPQLFDTGSVHGSFINKKRIKPKIYVPLRVGDIMKFGQSSRMFILGGPAELMPEEGLSRQDRQRLAAMEAKEIRKEREKQVAQAQMAAALNKGISWGMGEEAIEEGEEGITPSVDWRAYSSTHTLTDKQQKLSDKIRRLENRIRNLTTESDKIRAKQSGMEELSVGQAQTLARNEKVIDDSTDDLEDLEEQLNSSIAESLKGKKNKLTSEKLKTEKRKSKEIEEPRGKESESEEDDFYDRTTGQKSKRQRNEIKAQDPSSIFGRKAALSEEAEKLRKEIKEEESRNLEINHNDTDQQTADPLDAFMNNVATEIEHGQVAKLRQQVNALEVEIKGLEVLLAKADPDGYFKEGTHAAKVARERGIRLYNQDKDFKVALEKKKRHEAALKAQRELDAQAFVPEEEPPDVPDTETPKIPVTADQKENSGTPIILEENQVDEVEPAKKKIPNDSPHVLEQHEETGGLEIRKKPDRKPAAFAPSQNPTSLPPEEPSKGVSGKAEEKEKEDEVPDPSFVWKAPEGQTGDGRTALNAKFGY